MRISNPRIFAGDKPLATREFVTLTSDNLKDTLSGTITDNYNTLSDAIKNIKDSYAWLNTDGKVDPSLLPPLAIINTVEKKLDEIKAEAQNPIAKDGDDLMSKWFENNKNNYQLGDLIIVGYAEDMTEYENLKSALGPWIVSNGELIKLAFPTTDILTINNVGPDINTGNLTLKLVDILKQKNGITTGRVEELNGIIYNLKIDENNRFGIYTDLGNSELAFVGYAKYDELNSVSGIVSGHTSDIENIRKDIADHTTELSNIFNDIAFIKPRIDEAIGIVKYDNVTFDDEIQATGEISGDSGIKYDLDAGENLYKAVIKNLNKGTQVLALTENGIPIYPDLFFEDKDDDHVDLNIVLVAESLPSGSYTLYVLDTVNNIVDSAKANV